MHEAPYPSWLNDLLSQLHSHLAEGVVGTYEEIPLLGPCSSFTQRVRNACRMIPVGHTMTYGALAHQVGSPGGAQAVGQVMKRNPFPLVIPCHRVVGSGRHRWHYSAGGPAMKKRLLAMESASDALF